jgi:hypothetical protein
MIRNLAFVLALASWVPAFCSPSMNCAVTVGDPKIVRLNGAAEPTGDVVIVCTPNPLAPTVSALANFSLFLNVPLTSRLTDAVTMASEALLLIDEPQPGVSNTTNGFPYTGQILGTPGAAAGAFGSGNVYQGQQTSVNIVQWVGVPIVTGSTRVFRLTNIHGNASFFGGPGVISAAIAISGTTPLVLVGEQVIVAFGNDNGVSFSSSGGPVLNLHFAETFAAAFRKRIENTTSDPLTPAPQDVPGQVYCTESGFTPEFSPLTPGAIGSATTGTRLLAQITHIPHHATALTVPTQVISSSGVLVAQLVSPPLGSDFAGGTVTSGGGTTSLPVSAAHTLDLLYEITAASPFQRINGCGALDAFDISVSASSGSLAPANVTGRLAPVDGTASASATAAIPRFLP